MQLERISSAVSLIVISLVALSLWGSCERGQTFLRPVGSGRMGLPKRTAGPTASPPVCGSSEASSRRCCQGHRHRATSIIVLPMPDSPKIRRHDVRISPESGVSLETSMSSISGKVPDGAPLEGAGRFDLDGAKRPGVARRSVAPVVSPASRGPRARASARWRQRAPARSAALGQPHESPGPQHDAPSPSPLSIAGCRSSRQRRSRPGRPPTVLAIPARQRKRPSVGMARDRGASASDQEVEIAAFVCLKHVIDVQALVASPHFGLVGWARRRKPLGEFGIADVQMQPARVTVELDPVTVAYQRPAARRRQLPAQRAARRCRRRCRSCARPRCAPCP